MRRGDPGYTRTLLAFYDLKVAPVTFDFLWFLVGAELARRAARADKVHVVNHHLIYTSTRIRKGNGFS